MTTGFILTKWYVNKGTVVNIESKNNGFILTKWYVNSFITISSRVVKSSFYIN